MLSKFTSIEYTSEATAKDGRISQVSVANGVLDLDLGEPGSQANPQANPESLFATAYATSLQRALADAADDRHVDIAGSTVTVDVSRGSTAADDDVLGMAIAVNVRGVAPTTAQALVAAATRSCRFSKLTSGYGLLTTSVTVS